MLIFILIDIHLGLRKIFVYLEKKKFNWEWIKVIFVCQPASCSLFFGTSLFDFCLIIRLLSLVSWRNIFYCLIRFFFFITQEHLDYEIIQSTNPEFNKAIVRVNIFRDHRQTIQVYKGYISSKYAFLKLLVSHIKGF